MSVGERVKKGRGVKDVGSNILGFSYQKPAQGEKLKVTELGNLMVEISDSKEEEGKEMSC